MILGNKYLNIIILLNIGHKNIPRKIHIFKKTRHEKVLLPKSLSLFLLSDYNARWLCFSSSRFIFIIYFKSAAKVPSANTYQLIHPFSHSFHPQTCVFVRLPFVIWETEKKAQPCISNACGSREELGVRGWEWGARI